jgi:uncharacterized membrane protein YphA (DoxX/SURF4 family)
MNISTRFNVAGLGAALFALLAPLMASAHVGYVIGHDEFAEHTGSDVPFLFQVFGSVHNLEVMAITFIIVAAGILISMRSTVIRRELEYILRKTYSYYELIPWIIRLSLGISLVGAGTSNALISPLVPNAAFSLLQIALGFMLLAGFLIGPVFLGAISVFMVALLQNFYILGNLDFLGLCIAALVLGQTWPGIDDLVGIPFGFVSRKLEPYVPFILRLGIGTAFLFLAWYEKVLNPHVSELVVTQYHFSSFITPALWVAGAGAIETIVGLMLLFGYKTRFAAALAFVVLCVSFFYFKESVYSHVTLFGTLSILFITGGGKGSIDAMKASKN